MSNIRLLNKLNWARIAYENTGTKADNDVAKLLQEAAAALEALEWSDDMDAAPRDGTPVLLYREGEVFTARTIHGKHGPGWCTPNGFEIFRATQWCLITIPEVGE